MRKTHNNYCKERSHCDKLCSVNHEMKNLRTDEIVLFRNLTKIGTDENKAIYSSVLTTFKFGLKCMLLQILTLPRGHVNLQSVLHVNVHTELVLHIHTASYFVKIIWCSCWFCNRRVAVAWYRMICLVPYM